MRLVRLVLLPAAVLVTVYFAVISQSPLPDNRYIVGYNDVILHACAFAAITVLALIGNGKVILTLALIVSAAGIIELMQVFEPGRTASLEDFAASAMGVLIGWALAFLAGWLWSRNRRPVD